MQLTWISGLSVSKPTSVQTQTFNDLRNGIQEVTEAGCCMIPEIIENAIPKFLAIKI